jgi:hypothetical protein
MEEKKAKLSEKLPPIKPIEIFDPVNEEESLNKSPTKSNFTKSTPINSTEHSTEPFQTQPQTEEISSI